LFEFPEIIQLIQKKYSQPGKVFLVGGAIRDSLVGRPCHDFDFVIPANAKQFARNLANEIGGDFFVLDEKRNIFRVLLLKGQFGPLILDISQMNGGSIEDDLAKRDFTINAMAVDLFDSEKVIDPSKGGRDLAEKWLRPVSRTSFSIDPVRIIRAVRYSVAYDLKIEPGTVQLISNALPSLKLISPERQRDELFKTLELPRAKIGFLLLKQLGCLDQLGFVTDKDFFRSADRLGAAARIIDILVGGHSEGAGNDFLSSTLYLRLARFRKGLQKEIISPNLAGRRPRELLLLGAYYWGTRTAEIPSLFYSLILSKEEMQLVQSICVLEAEQKKSLLNSDQTTSRRAYNYFKKYKLAGIPLIILALADYASSPAAEQSQNLWLSMVQTAEYLISVWFEHPEIVDPQPIFNGTDLINRFNINPGPVLGSLLDELREEQAAGEIVNINQAAAWVRHCLDNNK
jgi:tRNA nucleotidyltransferase/poly(A) polymerase